MSSRYDEGVIGNRWCRAVFCALVVVAVSATADAQWTSLGPGVDYLARNDAGPNRVRALRVNLCRAGVQVRATPTGQRGRRTSTWASGAGALAAVNGGFFLSGFRPDGGAAVGYGAAWPDSTETGYRAWFGFGRHRIHHSPAPEVMPTPAWVSEAAAGDATLVSGGRAVNCGGCGGGRAPRTGVGYTANRRQVFFVTVDGRSSTSRGMTIDEFAVLMAGFGVDRAMNLDGGGSTTMWTRAGGVVNRPSDGSERSVANHFGVFASGSGRAEHCPDAYGATFVRSTFPGGLTIRAEAGSVVSGGLRFRNSGTRAWNGNTKLAPSPRDVASPLARAGWLSPTRIAASGAVAVSAEHEFRFEVQVPETPGTTNQNITLVQEAATWFGDALGPPDGAVTLRVVSMPPPNWRAEIVSVNVGGVTGTRPVVNVTAGVPVAARVLLRNTGRYTWPRENVRLATTDPRNHVSAIATPGWFAPTRPDVTARAVSPGSSIAFTFDLVAPSVGTHRETLGIVNELVSWFADSGGPADDAIVITLNASAMPPPDTGPPDTGADTGPPDTGAPDTGADADPDDASATDTGSPDVGAPDVGTDVGTDTEPLDAQADADASVGGDGLGGDCDCHVTSRSEDAPWLAVILFGSFVLRRRRPR